MVLLGILTLIVAIGCGVLVLLRKLSATQEDVRQIRSEIINLHFDVVRHHRPPFGRRGKTEP